MSNIIIMNVIIDVPLQQQ